MFDRFGNTDILMTFQMRKESIGRKINNYVLKLRSQKLRVVYFYLYFITLTSWGRKKIRDWVRSPVH